MAFRSIVSCLDCMRRRFAHTIADDRRETVLVGEEGSPS
jgi:hypothetical protein